MEMAKTSKGDFGKRHCNTEMSTVIPIDLKSAKKATKLEPKEIKTRSSSNNIISREKNSFSSYITCIL